MSTYPIKIAQQPNGVYTWSCPIEAEYYRSSIRPGLYACIGIAVFLLIFDLALSATDSHECYELTEDLVKFGYGRSSVYFDFKKVRIYVTEEDYNLVRGHIQSGCLWRSNMSPGSNR